MKRWIVRIFGGLLFVLGSASLVIYVISNRKIHAVHTFRPLAIAAATDSASLARGEHLAKLSCFGCHADSLKGQVLFDEPMIARLVAPNVPAKLETLTDGEFAGFMRTGVKKDGTSPFVMPPPGLYHMSDSDLSALLGYLRSLPKVANTLPPNTFRLMGRFGVAMGEFKTAVNDFDTTMARVGDDPAWATTRNGEYLARMICASCHGRKLTGDPASPSPNLSGALGYSAEQFTTLLRTGTPRDPATKLVDMAAMAKEALYLLTDEEIAAIYGYIKALPATGVAARQ